MMSREQRERDAMMTRDKKKDKKLSVALLHWGVQGADI